LNNGARVREGGTEGNKGTEVFSLLVHTLSSLFGDEFVAGVIAFWVQANAFVFIVIFCSTESFLVY